MRIIIYIILLLVLIPRVNAQNISQSDTIEYARAKAYEQDFQTADRLLTLYNSHNSDINALRLHAQVLYWMKEFVRSRAIYERTLTTFPEVEIVKLDYARMLFELNYTRQSETLLKEYLITDPKNPEAHILLAYIHIGQGHFNTARKDVSVVLADFPDNPTAQAIIRNITIATAPYVQASTELASDDQPLQKTSLNLEAGWHRSWAFSPVMQINRSYFNSEGLQNNSTWVQVGNTLEANQSGFSLLLKAGVFNHPIAAFTALTGGGTITQKITKSLSLAVSAEKMPYQYTRTSVEKPIMQQFSSLALHYSQSSKWLGKAAWEQQRFADGNKIQTLYGWALAPIIHSPKFKLKAGYAFSYANTDKNTFTSIEPISTLVQTTPPWTTVPGYYNPYFTPTDFTVHSILASLDLVLAKKVTFSFNGNIGFLASASNPVLLFTVSGDATYGIDKEFYTQSFLPVKLPATLTIKLSDNLTFTGKYEYNRLLFYTIHQGSLAVKYSFVHEPKRKI